MRLVNIPCYKSLLVNDSSQESFTTRTYGFHRMSRSRPLTLSDSNYTDTLKDKNNPICHKSTNGYYQNLGSFLKRKERDDVDHSDPPKKQSRNGKLIWTARQEEKLSELVSTLPRDRKDATNWMEVAKQLNSCCHCSFSNDQCKKKHSYMTNQRAKPTIPQENIQGIYTCIARYLYIYMNF